MTISAVASTAERSGVRPFVPEDLPALVELHRRGFASSAASSSGELRSHLEDLFLRPPWGLRSPTSLVYRDDEGEVVGCLGVMPRPMTFAGRDIVAAVSHDFVVRPDHRASPVAMALLQAFLGGPQDLSLAEGNHASLRLWRALGGTASTAHSLRWTFPVRPFAYALSRLLPATSPRALRVAARAGSRLPDALAVRWSASPFRRQEVHGQGEELGPEALVAAVEEVGERFALRPRYEPEAVRRLCAIFRNRPGGGRLRGRFLRGDGKVLGWYLYHPDRRGIAQVLQMGAVRTAARKVFGHLLEDARAEGAVAVSGRLDPFWLETLSRRSCVFHHGPAAPWTLVHSKQPSIVEAILRGDAFLTHLEGEWWV